MERRYLILIIAGALILIGALILFVTVPSEQKITGQVISSPVSQVEVEGEGGCLGEGLVSPAIAQGIWCCEGLEKKVAITYLDGRCQGELSDSRKIACINCGDGICEITEKCLCPNDCRGQ